MLRRGVFMRYIDYVDSQLQAWKKASYLSFLPIYPHHILVRHAP
jgi:hypothetical protein